MRQNSFACNCMYLSYVFVCHPPTENTRTFKRKILKITAMIKCCLARSSIGRQTLVAHSYICFRFFFFFLLCRSERWRREKKLKEFKYSYFMCNAHGMHSAAIYLFPLLPPAIFWLCYRLFFNYV